MIGRNLQAWRQTVRTAAEKNWQKDAPSKQSLRIVVSYFHEGSTVRIDNDNLLKPIQDSLNGLIYEDDRQITDTVVRKTPIDGRFYVRGASLVLLHAFSHGDEFLQIVIEEAPDHGVLLE